MSSKNVAKADLTDGYLEKVVLVNRVAKVVKGGRQFGFTALTVVGNGKGKVGVGYGKAKEVPSSIRKSLNVARKNMVDISLENSTIGYAVYGRYGASLVYMQPASPGTGIIAGGAMRGIFEVLGVSDILSKCIGSKKALNVVKATVEGLKQIKSKERIAAKRGKTIKEIWG